jgi:hypothetical protein
MCPKVLIQTKEQMLSCIDDVDLQLCLEPWFPINHEWTVRYCDKDGLCEAPKTAHFYLL